MMRRLLSLTPFLLLSTPVFAGPIFTEVGPELHLMPGMWGRAFPASDGWHLFYSNQQGYWHVPMAADLSVDDRQSKKLTESITTQLVDHSVALCPDGTWLHVASANINTFNDAAYAFRYNADLSLIGSSLLDQNASVPHNDMALVCSEYIQAAGFGGGQTTLYKIGPDGKPAGKQALQNSLSSTGAALLGETDPRRLTMIGLSGQSSSLQIRTYDDDLKYVGSAQGQNAAQGEYFYWAQGLIRAGNAYIVAHMGKPTGSNYSADSGNVWIEAYDLEWKLLDQVQVSKFEAPEGGMRPGLARKGSQLLVTIDRAQHVYGFPVSLDLAALGITGEEPGGWDITPTPTPPAGTPEASQPPGSPGPGTDPTPTPAGPGDDGTGEDDGSGACGCVTGATPRTGGLAGAGLAALLLGRLARRRRHGRSQKQKHNRE